ncbi:unnamed protein product, partial [Leptidea sinapis]
YLITVWRLVKKYNPAKFESEQLLGKRSGYRLSPFFTTL